MEPMERLLKERQIIQLTEVTQAEGKTVARVVDYGSEYLIAFTDNSFLSLQIAYGYEDSADISINQPPSNYCLVDAGLITEEECQAAEEASQLQRHRAQEESNRRLYEALKKKFEAA